MASPTVESEFTVVYVIGTMAVAAAVAELHLYFERPAMTGFARYVLVRTFKRKIGHGIVIESPLLPLDRRMAASAVLLEASLVAIVVRMA